MPSALTIPDDFGAGGKGISPSGSHGTPSLRDILRACFDNGPTGRIQSGQGTLVAGTFTVAAGIALGASSRIVLTFAERPGTTTNLATLAVTARTNGAEGVATFTVEAVLATGLIDADAVGAVDYVIVD